MFIRGGNEYYRVWNVGRILERGMRLERIDRADLPSGMGFLAAHQSCGPPVTRLYPAEMVLVPRARVPRHIEF